VEPSTNPKPAAAAAAAVLQGEGPPQGAISLGGAADASETVSFFVEPSSNPNSTLSKFVLIQHVDTYAGEWSVAANSTLELKIFW
jgi:hypothetical protein